MRRKAALLGDEGARWLVDLRALVDDLETQWGISVGRTLTGGTAGYVAAATLPDGTGAVLKIVLPEESEGPATLRSEIVNLSVADGRGYARLLAHDSARGAMLLERLGRPLNALGLSTRDQIAIICSTLQRAWVPVPEGTLIHGDAHNANTLEDLEAIAADRSEFKFVDPDGHVGERAYDLAIPMREFNAELLAGDATILVPERGRYLAHLTGVGEREIWEWGFVERVSSGLYVTRLGREQWGRKFLAVADRIAAIDP